MAHPPLPSQLLTIEYYPRPGVIQFDWGHPASALLPLDAMGRAAAEAIGRHGDNTLLYGAAQGPGPLIELLVRRLNAHEGLALTPEHMLITGGASLAIDQICTLLTRPGDAVLVPVPTYHLAVGILRDHPLDLVPVAGDEKGVSVEALAEAVVALRAEGRRPRMVYVIPTFANPTGATMPTERRQALADLARRENLLVVEDDVYRELCYEGSLPPSIYSYAPDGPVLRFANGGMLYSGGGVPHFAAMVVETFFGLDAYDAHLAHVKASYRARRDALLAALATHLPPGCAWSHPQGGYFLWLRLPPGITASALLPVAEQHGVSFLPGNKFGLGHSFDEYARLSFSMLEPDELAEGARRLGQAMRA
jgi:2-aminoadipate transaminase